MSGRMQTQRGMWMLRWQEGVTNSQINRSVYPPGYAIMAICGCSRECGHAMPSSFLSMATDDSNACREWLRTRRGHNRTAVR